MLADNQYIFLVSRFIDPVDACFYAAVSSNGSKVTSASKSFRFQTLAISGLAKYGRQYANAAALQAATRAFQAWDGAVHDPVNRGYADVTLPANSTVQQLAASKEAFKKADMKRLELQLCVLTMLIDLARADPLNLQYSSRLKEMVELLTKSMIVPATTVGASTPASGVNSSSGDAAGGSKVVLGPYVAMAATNDWSMLVEGPVSYGLTAEYVWHIDAALQLLLSQQQTTPEEAAEVRLLLVAVGRAAARTGTDLQYGGTYEEGVVGDVVPTKPDKPAWVQIEASLLCMKLYQLTGELGYLALADKALEYLQTYLWDSTSGEKQVASSREDKLLNREVQCGTAAGSMIGGMQKSELCDKQPRYTALWHASRGLVQLSSWLLDEGVQGLPSCNE